MQISHQWFVPGVEYRQALLVAASLCAIVACRGAMAKSPILSPEDGPTQASDKNVRRASLVLHYTFDRHRMVGIEPDASEYDNNARIHGATQRHDGLIGGAMEFDGEDDFLDCGNDDSLNFEDRDFSVALWFRTPLKNELPYSYNPFINKGAAGSLRPARPGYALYATHEHGHAILRWDFGQRGHEARARVITREWEADCWNHIVLVRREHAIEAWLNGIQLSTQIQKPTSQATVSGPESLLIGKVVSNRGAMSFFQGVLDDVRVYDGALSAEEIEALFDMAKAQR